MERQHECFNKLGVCCVAKKKVSMCANAVTLCTYADLALYGKQPCE